MKITISQITSSILSIVLICACEGNVDYTSPQEGKGDNVDNNKKSNDNKKNTGGTPSKIEEKGGAEVIIEGIKVLDNENSPKEIVFGCREKNLTDDTKITICSQKDISSDIKSDIKNTIKTDINNDILWEKLENNTYAKITLDNVDCCNLTPKLFRSISRKLKYGGKLEIVGLPNYLSDNNNEPNKILLWEKDNGQDRAAIKYFDINKLPTNWHNWHSLENAKSILDGAPYRIIDVEGYLTLTKNRSLLSSDKTKLIRDAYEVSMKPFKVASDLVREKLKAKSERDKSCLGFIGGSEQESGEESEKKLQQESLIYLKGYFNPFDFQYEKIEENSITFVKQEGKPEECEKTEKLNSNNEEEPQQTTLKK